MCRSGVPLAWVHHFERRHGLSWVTTGPVACILLAGLRVRFCRYTGNLAIMAELLEPREQTFKLQHESHRDWDSDDEGDGVTTITRPLPPTVDVNAHVENGMTALMTAASRKMGSAVKMLLGVPGLRVREQVSPSRLHTKPSWSPSWHSESSTERCSRLGALTPCLAPPPPLGPPGPPLSARR